MVDLVAIKVTLRRTNEDGSRRVDQNGNPTVWPSFRELPKDVLKGRKPQEFIDQDGTGWMHNRQENLGTGHAFGEAVALVPEDFANAADGVVDSCVVLTEAQAKTFCDTKHFAGLETEARDNDVLTALNSERALLVATSQSTTAIDAKIAKALDPDDPEPGVRKVKRPTSFDDLKARKGIVVKLARR